MDLPTSEESPTESSESEALALKTRVEARALDLGFDLVGVAPAQPNPETQSLRQWVSRGFHGEMGWIARRLEERVDPSKVLEGARSMIAVGFSYDPWQRSSPSVNEGAIARYAGGKDYHDVLLSPLKQLASELGELAGREVNSRVYVDTGPVQERAAAAYAGLGWIGKNGCLIHRELGSYVFLGVILTDLVLPPAEKTADHCGTCTACIDACPTQAIVQPGVVDSRRCISYTTIEQRGPIPLELRESQGQEVFGCDICQAVCPWNGEKHVVPPQDALGLRTSIAPADRWVNPSLEWLLGLDEEAWRVAARKSALKRTKWRGLMRNALVAAGNSKQVQLLPLLQPFVEGEDGLLAEHASWAKQRLETIADSE